MTKRMDATGLRRINTFAEAIEFLGGHAVVAAWLGTSERHIATMKHRGRAPRGFLLHFYLTLRSRGADPAPAVFGLESFDHVIMPKDTGVKAKPRRRRSSLMSLAA